MNKAVFFDRDGVLNKSFVVNDKSYAPRTYQDFEIYEQAQIVIDKIRKMGYLILVITNQPDIRKGLIVQDELKKMHQMLKKKLKVEDIYCCPHVTEDNCQCRKPKPGMLMKASEKWSIDLRSSFMVGDQHTDVGAGKEAGCITILLKKSYSGKCQPDYTIDNLSEIVDIVKHNGNS